MSGPRPTVPQMQCLQYLSADQRLTRASGRTRSHIWVGAAGFCVSHKTIGILRNRGLIRLVPGELPERALITDKGRDVVRRFA